MSLATLYSTLNNQGITPTLFGVGPLSRTIVDTTIECSIEQNVPIIFIASRNQIESDELGSGYVEGWDQHDLSHYVRKCVEGSSSRHFCYIGRDHGGPWQRDSEYQAKLSWTDALNNALVSYRDDIDAGFDYLHIDTSRDPSFSDMVPMDLAAERVIELIQCTEEYRKQVGRGHIDYEISLEETGGVTPAADFAYFTDQLLREIERRNLPRPLFVVGNTGTLTKMDTNIGNVDFPAVAELRAIAVRHQLIFKEHNADYLDLPTLARHPKEGIGMINVAPEFGKLETEALLQLADKEEASLGSGDVDHSMLRATLLRFIRRSNKWKKWVADPEAAEDVFDDEQSATRIAVVNGHYFFRKEEVREARRKLYDNVQKLNLCDDAQEYVKAHIRSGVLRYINGLGLKDLLLDAKAA
jgi:D-tagatose-1,6-bisphosphate aldolase subunit GatZ/KbaZ